MCINLDSLQKFKAQSALKIVCQHKAHELRYKSTCIIHLVTGILLSLELYTENPDGVGDTVNTFLFPDHSISTGSGESLLDSCWDTELDISMLDTYTDTNSLIKFQKVAPIIGLESVVNILYQ